jgi:hypothetical protein
MAIYHLSASIVKRSAGRFVTAAAAYRAGAKIEDITTGLVHDYTRKKGIDYSEIMSPISASLGNKWLTDRQELWNKVEEIEKRKDAQLAREITLAIPRELDRQEQIALVREYVQTNYVAAGMVADINLHHLDGDNPHAHILLSMRNLQTTPEGTVEFGLKNTDWNSKELLLTHRKSWEEITNKYLADYGSDIRIDCRSLKDQGSEFIPQIHVGVHAAAMHRKGIQTDRRDEFERIEAANNDIRARLETIYEEEVEPEVVEPEVIQVKQTKKLATSSWLDLNHPDRKCGGIKFSDVKQKTTEMARLMINESGLGDSVNQCYESGKSEVYVYNGSCYQIFKENESLIFQVSNQIERGGGGFEFRLDGDNWKLVDKSKYHDECILGDPEVEYEYQLGMRRVGSENLIKIATDKFKDAIREELVNPDDHKIVDIELTSLMQKLLERQPGKNQLDDDYSYNNPNFSFSIYNENLANTKEWNKYNPRHGTPGRIMTICKDTIDVRYIYDTGIDINRVRDRIKYLAAYRHIELDLYAHIEECPIYEKDFSKEVRKDVDSIIMDFVESIADELVKNYSLANPAKLNSEQINILLERIGSYKIVRPLPEVKSLPEIQIELPEIVVDPNQQLDRELGNNINWCLNAHNLSAMFITDYRISWDDKLQSLEVKRTSEISKLALLTIRYTSDGWVADEKDIDLKHKILDRILKANEKIDRHQSTSQTNRRSISR